MESAWIEEDFTQSIDYIQGFAICNRVSFCGGPMLKCSSVCNVSGVAVQMQFGIPGAGISEVNNCC